MFDDVFAYHGLDFFEKFSSVLHKLHIATIFHLVVRSAQISVVVADVIRKFSYTASGFDFEVGLVNVFVSFQNNGCGHITKDKVTIAVPPLEVSRADFRVDHDGPPN